MSNNGSPQPYIEFSDVSKSFGTNCVLDHVNFFVMPAETLCILGRSGVGNQSPCTPSWDFLKPDSGKYRRV